MDYQYRVGGSLAYNHPTYVERQADRELLSALKNGDFCYVFNCRQMGKSSLRVRVAHALQEMGMACASIDITGIGSDDNPSRWYNGLIARLFAGFALTGQLNLKAWLQEREERSPVHRLRDFIEEVLLVYSSRKLYIFIDEIDKTLSLSFSVDDFFALIRYCYNQRAENESYERITFALFGVATPSDLIREKTQTSFNIGRAIELEGFTIEEVKPLESGLKDRVREPARILEEILFWTGGQPFLTQKVCRLVGDGNTPDPDVGSIVRENIVRNWESSDEPVHFRTIAERLLRNPRQAGRLLEIYRQILEKGAIIYEDSLEISELRLSGLVLKRQNRLLVYNSIYREIFNLEWVRRELDKLRPYSEAIEAWKESDYTDESTLLRGKSLQNALEWSRGKSLGDLEYRFLSAGQELEKRSAEVHLENQREANRILALANQKARRRIQGGSAFTIVSALGAAIALFQVNREVQEARTGVRLQREAYTSLRQSTVEPIDSLISSLQAGIELQKIVRDGRRFAGYPATGPLLALQQILDNITEKNRLEGHRGKIYSVSQTPDGGTIATASEDRTVRLWDRRGEPLKVLTGHGGAIYGVDIAPDGQKIATASEDKTVRVQDLQGRMLVTLRGHERSVYSVRFSPDGQKLVSASRDRTARLWNLRGQELHVLRGHQKSVDDASFSPDGRKVATASRDGTIKIWDETGKLLSGWGRENIDAFYSVSFSPDGRQIAAAAGDKTARVWDASGKLLLTLAHEDDVNKVAFSPTGEFIATASRDGRVKLWDRRGKEIALLRGHRETVVDLVIDRDGKRIVSGSGDGTARVWDLTAPALERRPGAGRGGVGIDPGRSTVAVVTENGRITLLDLQGKTIGSFPSGIASIYSLAFSRDGGAIAAVGRNGEIRIWDRRGRALAGSRASEFPLHSVAFTPDGKEAIAGSSDGRLHRWDWQHDPPREIGTFRADNSIIYSIALSPDGRKIATASRETVKIWERAGDLRERFSWDSFPVQGVSFSPDGQQIATISRDGTARNRDARGNLLAEYKIPENRVGAIAFAPDGRKIFLVSGDGRATVMEAGAGVADLEKLIVRGCSWLDDYLSTHPTEREKVKDCFSRF